MAASFEEGMSSLFVRSAELEHVPAELLFSSKDCKEQECKNSHTHTLFSPKISDLKFIQHFDNQPSSLPHQRSSSVSLLLELQSGPLQLDEMGFYDFFSTVFSNFTTTKNKTSDDPHEEPGDVHNAQEHEAGTLADSPEVVYIDLSPEDVISFAKEDGTFFGEAPRLAPNDYTTTNTLPSQEPIEELTTAKEDYDGYGYGYGGYWIPSKINCPWLLNLLEGP